MVIHVDFKPICSIVIIVMQKDKTIILYYKKCIYLKTVKKKYQGCIIYADLKKYVFIALQ